MEKKKLLLVAVMALVLGLSIVAVPAAAQQQPCTCMQGYMWCPSSNGQWFNTGQSCGGGGYGGAPYGGGYGGGY